ncbi:MAG: hypothetical protein PHW03_05055 [Eubacteriales bacterium]|nr:hypothetical protein [Eubacteriales bacterium]MDD4390153.1 hypothetical protein [Eubacteriales bacterium]
MDIFFSKFTGKRIAAMLAFLACIAMVLLPEAAILSAQKAIVLWAGSVFPSLFPFFICANFLNYLGVINRLNPAAFTFSISVMSGYPVGAKIIRDMRMRNYIGIDDAKRLISFCSTSGPTFMLGAVGIGMLGSVKAGAIISVCHYAAALLNGAIFAYRGGSISIKDIPQSAKSGSILDLLTEAILDALKSMGVILAYIVLFMFVTDLIQLTAVFSFLENIYLRIATKGIFEMTVGCSAMAYTAVSLQAKTIMCSIMVSFGGLSIIGQSLSMLSGSGISAKYFIFTKVCHALWAGLLSSLAICIFM